MTTWERFSGKKLIHSDKPRYQQITDLLCKEINSGTMRPGDPLPSENDFANIFDVSKNTVVRAIVELKNRGVVDRQQGKGTFVAYTPRLDTRNIIGMLMRTSGHLFGSLSDHLIHAIQKTDYYPLIINPFSCESPDVFRDKINRLIDTHPATIIADGDIDFPFDILKSRENDLKQMIFIHRFEYSEKFPNASLLLSDYFQGGYMVIKHFLDNGWEDCALLTYSHTPTTAHGNPSMPRNPIHKELLAGCRAAISDYGLDADKNLQIIFDFPEDIFNVLNSTKRPRAIFAFGDTRVKNIFKVARDLNLRIPEKLAVAGYYNTSWVDMYDVPLTSVSINFESICNEAIRVILEENSTKNTIKFRPKLIVRESTQL